jgi:hypothetical protein
MFGGVYSSLQRAPMVEIYLTHFYTVLVKTASSLFQQATSSSVLLAMPLGKKNKSTGASSSTQGEASQRPQTLLQRLSSGFTSFTINRGAKSISKRPETAPTEARLTREKIRRKRGPSDNLIVIPRLDMPKLSDSGRDCPYHPSSYHSFTGIEQGGCTCCGLRSSSKATCSTPASSRPCSNCRSRTPLSHLSSRLRCRRSRSGKSPAVESSLARLIECSESQGIPRIVPGAIVARRIGNPPRRSSLPDGRVPSYSTSHQPSLQAASSSRQGHIQHGQSGDPSGQDVRPKSPKLHHLHCLPNAKFHPYVHKHEISAHIAALRAGSPSPLRRPIHEERTPVDPHEPYEDFSRTVFYGTTTHWGLNQPGHGTHLSPRSGSYYTSGITDHVRNVIIEQENRSSVPTFEQELGRSQVYRRQLPPPPAHESAGGEHLLVESSKDTPQLRGGSAASLRFRLKRWILTCHGPWRSRDTSDSDSDNDLPPPHAPVPARVAHVLRSSRGRSMLPVGVAKVSAPSSQIDSSTTPSMDSNTAPSIDSTSTPRNSFASSTHQTGQNSAQFFPTSDSLQTYVPTLRGGSGSAVRLPPTLYWLAGGRGQPVKISSWKKQKEKKRMGGWLGMAMYSVNAGREYEVGDGESVSADSVASAKVTVGSRSVTGESHSSPVSGSSSISRKSLPDSDVGVEELALEDERADGPVDATGGAQNINASEGGA